MKISHKDERKKKCLKCQILKFFKCQGLTQLKKQTLQNFAPFLLCAVFHSDSLLLIIGFASERNIEKIVLMNDLLVISLSFKKAGRIF